MNHGEARGSGGRSPSYSHSDHRQESGTPATTVDRPFGESSGRRSRGSQGRRRYTPSSSAWVKKSSPVSIVDRKSQEDGIGSTKQPGEVAALKISGDNNDLLQSSASMNINPLSGGEDKDVRDSPGMHCEHPLNRMKDVSLSCQESPSSSTRYHKVEIPSVEDHDTAHKSGDAENASNESETRPFDLFLETKVFKLKPSILALSKDKRKETKGYAGSVIRPGMVLLKNYLSITDQVMILNKCRQLGLGEGGFYQPGYRDGASLHLKMMCLGKNWDPQTSKYGETRPTDGSTPPQIPVEFNRFVEKAIKESQSLAATNSKKMDGEDEMPSMSPDICIANFYTSSGRLGLHQDKDESWKSIRKGLPVVSFSIGDSAEFLYGDERDEDKAEMVVLESGDVLLFGGKSRNVFHGVRSIHQKTAPKVLVHETSLRPGRLNLTFRQY
uniref:DNA N(6)-methyladenine demethylase n=1 Tax=Noccaea caerulescens TaxID=107243 RepID=A0A1J3DNT1_NOCCA